MLVWNRRTREGELFMLVWNRCTREGELFMLVWNRHTREGELFTLVWNCLWCALWASLARFFEVRGLPHSWGYWHKWVVAGTGSLMWMGSCTWVHWRRGSRTWVYWREWTLARGSIDVGALARGSIDVNGLSHVGPLMWMDSRTWVHWCQWALLRQLLDMNGLSCVGSFHANQLWCVFIEGRSCHAGWFVDVSTLWLSTHCKTSVYRCELVLHTGQFMSKLSPGWVLG